MPIYGQDSFNLIHMYYAYYKVKLHRYYEGILTCYLFLHTLVQPNKLQLLHESVYLHTCILVVGTLGLTKIFLPIFQTGST